MKTIDYDIQRGEIWERLLIIKDRRTRRVRVPTAVAASLRIVGGVNAGDYVIPTEITHEGGVLMQLTPENVEWLSDGSYAWDMVVTVSRAAMFTATPSTETLVVKGTLSVTTYANITPMAVDGTIVPLEAVV